jgi:hypothetical protein
VNHCEPGDRIFLFGFSRGAYTVHLGTFAIAWPITCFCPRRRH